jgi:ankyrin repeat protein
MVAAVNGNIDVVRQLFHGTGASLSVTDSRGSTALVYAVKGGHRNIVEFFLSCENWISENNKSNGDNKCDKQYETIQEALIWASKLGHMDILEILLCNEDVIPLDVNKKCSLTGEYDSGKVTFSHILVLFPIGNYNFR